MTKATMPGPIGYFACNPETLEPMWDEGCVCQDNIYNQDDMGAVGRAIIFADQAEAYAAAKVREALEWQPIDTAPKDGSHILLRSRSGRMADGFWGVRYEVWSWPYVMTEPAYWMPLPPET